MEKFTSVEEFGNYIRNLKHIDEEHLDMAVLTILLEMQRRKEPETKLFIWLKEIGMHIGLLKEVDGSFTEQFKKLLDSVERLRMRPGYMISIDQKLKAMFHTAAVKKYLETPPILH